MIKSVITIGRQYGSGGREIGKKLSQQLGIDFYDNELINIAAKKSGISEELFEHYDEKPTSSFLYSLVTGGYATGDNMPFNHKLFLAQFDAIRSVAEKGPCIILGRCADYALEDFDNLINIFIHSNIDIRVQRAIDEYGLDISKAHDYVVKTDKKRASYYNFYSSKKWGNLENYDITVDSGLLGVDKTVELLKHFIELREK